MAWPQGWRLTKQGPHVKNLVCAGERSEAGICAKKFLTWGSKEVRYRAGQPTSAVQRLLG